MANKSKKDLKKLWKERYKKAFGVEPTGNPFRVNSGDGKMPKISRKTGRISNQKGAFGSRKSDADGKCYMTFPDTNHQRCLRLREEAKKKKEEKGFIKGLLAKTLGT